MLYNMRYLNEDALADYIAALEGGLREAGTAVSQGGSQYGGSIGVGSTKVDASTGTQTQDTVNMTDHSTARLKRLIDAGRKHSDEVGWTEVTQPSLDFSGIGIGVFIDWECDVYVPDGLAAFAKADEFKSGLEAMRNILPFAKTFGLDTSEAPDLDELDAMSSVMDSLDVAPVVIGDDSETEWRIVGSLDKKWITKSSEIDGRFRIVAKVTKAVGKDRWYPLLSLPGMNLVNREERRKKEREGPRNDSEKDQFVAGPLLVVDFLAIFS